jgi:hypothetical protein
MSAPQRRTGTLTLLLPGGTDDMLINLLSLPLLLAPLIGILGPLELGFWLIALVTLVPLEQCIQQNNNNCESHCKSQVAYRGALNLMAFVENKASGSPFSRQGI